MKMDLHCHSKHSKRPVIWIMKKLGCPESFTEPRELYALARQRGMDAVTITDHNVIDGCLEIADLENTFISCEYTNYFPEDGCKVHVLAYNITEAQHAVLDEARENIFDFVECCRSQGIFHVCAHPLWGPNGRLTPEHVEKLLLLFKNWEWNGDICPDMNLATRALLKGLSPELMDMLAEKHAFAPGYSRPWEKIWAGGSDDHSSLNLARTYTEVPDADTLDAFFHGLSQHHSKIRSRPTEPRTLARNIYGTAYQYYRRKFGLERYANSDMFFQFMERALRAESQPMEIKACGKLSVYLAKKWRGKTDAGDRFSLFELVRDEATRVIGEDFQLKEILREGHRSGADMDEKWYDFVNQLSNKALYMFGRHVAERFAGGNLFEIFNAMGSAGAIYTLLSPFFVAFSHYRDQHDFSRRVLEHFRRVHGQRVVAESGPRFAHFSDTFQEVNGVAKTLKEQLQSAERLDRDYTILTCGAGGAEYQPRVRQFGAVGSLALPEYPEIKLLCPPFLSMLQHCYEERYTHLHLATPGPVGLAGLAIAKILRLPVSGTYHTEFPQYMHALTDDNIMEQLAWKLMIWFYAQLDRVYVPSRATGQELAERGVPESKIQVYPRGVDTVRFHPNRRGDLLSARFGVAEGETTLLYVGRISTEKNLHILARAYRAIIEAGKADARLVVVGDGPYRAEMETELAGMPAVFTGYLDGDDLADVYASSDVFVFPSATDTFGNVVLEAQASGIPVVVTDKGGPCENCLPGETGLVVEAGSVASLQHAMETLLSDAPRRQAMGRAARAYAEPRGFDAAFSELWELYMADCPRQEHSGIEDHLSQFPARVAIAS